MTQPTSHQLVTTNRIAASSSGKGFAFTSEAQRCMKAAPAALEKGPPRMTQQRFFKRMVVDVLEDDTYLLHMGEMDIWDGADLALLREGLTQFIERDRCRAIVVDMQHVKYIPSGFFGMLFDWHEKRNVWFALTTPQPNVQRMLWFQQFFRRANTGWFELDPEGRDVLNTPAGYVPESMTVEEDIEYPSHVSP